MRANLGGIWVLMGGSRQVLPLRMVAIRLVS